MDATRNGKRSRMARDTSAEMTAFPRDQAIIRAELEEVSETRKRLCDELYRHPQVRGNREVTAVETRRTRLRTFRTWLWSSGLWTGPDDEMRRKGLAKLWDVRGVADRSEADGGRHARHELDLYAAEEGQPVTLVSIRYGPVRLRPHPLNDTFPMALRVLAVTMVRTAIPITWIARELAAVAGDRCTPQQSWPCAMRTNLGKVVGRHGGTDLPVTVDLTTPDPPSASDHVQEKERLPARVAVLEKRLNTVYEYLRRQDGEIEGARLSSPP
jgi:hypothetical protein